MHAVRLAQAARIGIRASDHHRCRKAYSSPHSQPRTASVHQPRLFGPFITRPGHATSATSSSPAAPTLQICASVSLSPSVFIRASCALAFPRQQRHWKFLQQLAQLTPGRRDLAPRQQFLHRPAGTSSEVSPHRRRFMRPPRRNGQDLLSAQISNYTIAPRSFRRQRHIIRFLSKPLRMLLAQYAGPDAPSTASAALRRFALHHLRHARVSAPPSSNLTPQLIIHRPPIVRIHQREIPDLPALIHIRHSRRRVLHQRLRQRVNPSRAGDLSDELLKCSNEILDRPAIASIYVFNAFSYSALFATQLVRIFASRIAFCMYSRRRSRIDWPSAHQCLVQKPLRTRIDFVVAELRILRAPGRTASANTSGISLNTSQPRPHIIAALGVVRAQRRHRERERLLHLAR